MLLVDLSSKDVEIVGRGGAIRNNPIHTLDKKSDIVRRETSTHTFLNILS